MLKRFLKGSSNGKSRSHRHAPGNGVSSYDTPSSRLSLGGQSVSPDGDSSRSSGRLGESSRSGSARSQKHGVEGFMGFLKTTLGGQKRRQGPSTRRRMPYYVDDDEVSSSYTASPGYSEFSHVQDAEDILGSNDGKFSIGGVFGKGGGEEEEEEEEADCFESQMDQQTPLGPDPRTCSLLMEYRHLQDNAPRGLYVCPDAQDLLIWHCVLILRQGHYKGAILKFILRISEDYPDSAPTVQFITRVYHPLVEEASGMLDISLAFPTWQPGRDYAVLVLAFVKKIFYRSDLIGWRGGEEWVPNPAALRAFNMAFEQGDKTFQREVDKCIMESQREVFLSSSSLPGCTLVFKEYDDATESAHSMISAALRNMPEELVGPQRTQAFCDWLTERFIPRCEAQRQESTRDQPEIKQLWTGPEDEQQGERSVESESPGSIRSPSGSYRQRKKGVASEAPIMANDTP